MDVICIDINCDVGEGMGNEANLLPLISSCNIATGGHAGDASSMRKVVRLAKANNVKIGAHPSYPDKENFGRKSMQIPSEMLEKSIQDQVSDFQKILSEEKSILHHIKPHGALYNDIAKDEQLAETFLKSIAKYKEDLYLYVPFNSAIEKCAKKEGFKIKYEAFGDRNYNADGSLVSRKEENALISDPIMVLEHIANMALHHEVVLPNKQRIPIKANTYCIHGDTPSAYEILQYLSNHLPESNIMIEK
jgi:UPF0271 protein